MAKSVAIVQDKIAAIGAVLSAVAAFLAALAKLPEAVEQTLAKWGATTLVIQVVGAILLGLVSLSFIWAAVRRRSRLLIPAAFRIDATKPRFLKGREDEIQKTVQLCRTQRIVFLEGESGSGKTALLQAGLVPALKEAGMLPVYVDLAGIGWDEHLSRASSQALRDALTSDEYKQVTSGASDLPSVLEECLTLLKRVPVIVFDQFDDYQTEHAERFRREGVWKQAAEIAGENKFWALIATLIQTSRIHCVVATRADAAAGLSTVRFVDEKTFHLTRVSQNLIEPLLDEVVGGSSDSKPVVDRPDAGWNRLRQRLLRDIAVNDRVLPIQLVVVLEALRRLKFLTVQEYEKVGGALGLERLHVERNVDDTVDAAGMPRPQVLHLLHHMCNAQGTKTIPRSRQDLLTYINSDSKSPTDEETVQKALSVLVQRNVVRKRVGTATDNDIWLLSHDFLARGVSAAQRFVNRWRLALEDAQKALDEATGIAPTWTALLGPHTQIRLAWERLRGRLEYREQRRIAFLSLLKFAPAALLLAGLVGSGIWWGYETDRAKASEIFNAIGQQASQTSRHEIRQLNLLAASSKRVQEMVVRLAFERGAEFDRSARRLDVLLHIWLGMDPDGVRRKQLFDEIVREAIEQKPDDRRVYKLAAYAWGQAPGTPAQAAYLQGKLLSVMKPEDDAGRFAESVVALSSFPGQLSPAQLRDLYDNARKVAPGSAALGDTPDLAQAFALLLVRYPATIAMEILGPARTAPAEVAQRVDSLESRVINSLLERFVLRTTRWDYTELPGPEWFVPVTSLCDRLSQRQVQAVVAALNERSRVAATGSISNDKVALDSLEKCLGSRQKGGDPASASPSIQQLRDSALKSAGDDLFLATQALMKRSSEITPEMALQLSSRLYKAVEDDEGSHTWAFAEAITVLAAKRGEAHAQAALEELLKVLKRKTYLYRTKTFGASLDVIPQLRREALGALLLKDMPDALDERMWTIAGLIDWIAPPDAAKLRFDAASLIVARIGKPRWRLGSSSETYVWNSLTAKLSEPQVRSLATSILGAKAAPFRRSEEHVTLLLPLATKLSDDQVVASTDRLFALTNNDEGNRSIEFFGENSRAAPIALFCSWAIVAAPRDHRIVEKLATVLSQVASSIPYFTVPEARSYGRDKFGRWTGTDFERGTPEEAKIADLLKSLSPEAHVNALKLPFAIGPVRRILLAALEDRAGHKFNGNLWEFVTWAQSPPAARWRFDLVAPPERFEPLDK